jgi:hypothetical protein
MGRSFCASEAFATAAISATVFRIVRMVDTLD